MDDVDDWPVSHLSTPDAWEFLHRHHLGRLGYVLGGEVSIVPVNYGVSDGRLYIRTAPGSKLLAVVLDHPVAFEVDEVGPDRATSVVVRGRAVLLDDSQAHVVDDIRLHSWLATPKHEVVAIHVTAITGRSFDLQRTPQAGPGRSAGRQAS